MIDDRFNMHLKMQPLRHAPDRTGEAFTVSASASRGGVVAGLIAMAIGALALAVWSMR